MSINYQTKQGDCIFSIAFEQGFFADTIWNHPNNAELKKKRQNPNVLMPGDTIFVPDKRVKEVGEPTNQVHKFRCKNTPKTFQIRLMCLDSPVKDKAYTLNVDGIEKEGKTDSEGWLRQFIPPNAKIAKLILDEGTIYELKLGNLDPVSEVSGVQGRLHSLGYYQGSINGRMDEKTKEALEVFQRSQNLEVTGEANKETKDSLVQLTEE